MNLRNIDLYLLAAFDVLMKEKNISRAAERMHMTQPAMSYALNRLRILMDDPLLTRTPRGMQPTVRALSLVGPVKRALVDIEAIFTRVTPFDPLSSVREFVIATNDHAEVSLLRPLAAQLKTLSPTLRLQTRTFTNEVGPLFERGEIELALGQIDPASLPAGSCNELLSEESSKCLLGDQAGLDTNPDNQTLDLEAYLRARHVVVSRLEGESDVVDRWLQTYAHPRHVAHTASHYLAAALIARDCGLMLTFPSGLTHELTRLTGARVVDAPASLPKYSLHMAWPIGSERDPSATWLRDQLRAIVKRRSKSSVEGMPIGKQQDVAVRPGL